uniref:Uncharacterized protein n=1 Tax=Rhizophora mucronata TaxID=61149 RepID=A0A2P2NDP4_RHIMU
MLQLVFEPLPSSHPDHFQPIFSPATQTHLPNTPTSSLCLHSSFFLQSKLADRLLLL